jgi:uncharacterized membrane protein YkvA (DUF1232 family)
MSQRKPLIIDAVPERVSREETRAHAHAGASAEASRTYNANASGSSGNSAKKQPTWKRAVIGVLALLYVLSPLDLVPDWIPLVGWLDDIGLLAWAARQVFFKK